MSGENSADVILTHFFLFFPEKEYSILYAKLQIVSQVQMNQSMHITCQICTIVLPRRWTKQAFRFPSDTICIVYN